MILHKNRVLYPCQVMGAIYSKQYVVHVMYFLAVIDFGNYYADSSHSQKLLNKSEKVNIIWLSNSTRLQGVIQYLHLNFNLNLKRF